MRRTDPLSEVLGSQEEAEQWLERHDMALDGHKPIDLLSTLPGLRTSKIIRPVSAEAILKFGRVDSLVINEVVFIASLSTEYTEGQYRRNFHFNFDGFNFKGR